MIEIVILSLLVYLSAGVLFAIAFVAFGLRQVDRAASDASAGFRMLVLPGCTMLWPLMLVRWIRA